MGALRGYHGFNNWRKMVVEEESDYIDRTICFGFELEITQDYDVNGYWYWNNNKTPEKLADELESYFGDLFVYERDGSIGEGIEIISQPMSLKYYLENQDKFKRLLEMCNEENMYQQKVENVVYIFIFQEVLWDLMILISISIRTQLDLKKQKKLIV